MERLEMARERGARGGSALPLVMAIILMLFITAGVSAFQTSGVRRVHTKANLGFTALEVALSAIDEAASRITPAIMDQASAQAGVETLFPRGRFGDIQTFLDAIRDNRVPQGVAADGMDYRTISYSSGKSEKLFTGLTFTGHAVTIPMTGSRCRAHYSGAVPLRRLSAVTATPLRFRREHYTQAPRWVNWGIVQFTVAVEVGEGGATACRVVTVDRLFKFKALRDPGASTHYWALEVSRNNQRTMIRGSLRAGDPA